ncbi:MAG: hypothetical protein R2688_01015 [Fimbriimonadaceae bacterium]
MNAGAHYIVYKDGANVYQGSYIEHIDTQVTNGVVYGYQVYAYIPNGTESSRGAVKHGGTSLPGTVGLRIKIVNGDWILEWDAIPGATSYEVLAGTTHNSVTGVIHTGTGTSLNLGSQPNINFYSVRGVNGAGAGPIGNIVSNGGYLPTSGRVGYDLPVREFRETVLIIFLPREGSFPTDNGYDR